MKIFIREVCHFPSTLRTAPNLERQTLSRWVSGFFPIHDLNCFFKHTTNQKPTDVAAYFYVSENQVARSVQGTPLVIILLMAFST